MLSRKMKNSSKTSLILTKLCLTRPFPKLKHAAELQQRSLFPLKSITRRSR